ncbi:hypothetical protein BK668_18045 [Pseudomonas fluorescens]|nr:hypothetical protein BK668_18045 [Pseudomonas fluorescens]
MSLLIGVTLSWKSVTPSNNLLCSLQFIENMPALGASAKHLPIKEMVLSVDYRFSGSDTLGKVTGTV